jgi:alkyl sulfatase BDS1-like metallo-beta-lactamase superfamily hydrolase
MVFDLLGVRLDGPRADGRRIAIGWRFPDIDEAWTLRLEHAALHAWPALDEDVDVVLTMPRSVLTGILLDPTSMGAAVVDGTLQIEGDADALASLLSLLERPTPNFNIVEP